MERRKMGRVSRLPSLLGPVAVSAAVATITNAQFCVVSAF